MSGLTPDRLYIKKGIKMSEIGSVNAGTVHTVGEQSTSELEHTGSVQFMYAMLQMELAQTNKDAALNKIDGIRKQHRREHDSQE